MNRCSTMIAGIAVLCRALSIAANPVYVPIDSVKGPVCIISDTALQFAAPLSPSRSIYDVIVADGLAQITLFQTFVNDYGKIDDIAYIFPLPNDASVHAMEMKYRDSVYTAEIYEKAQAQTIYDSVVAAGGKAAMLLQSRPNVFVQHLANLAKGDTAYIKIKLTMPLKFNNGTYELSIPTMVAERYQSVNASPVGSSGRFWNPPPDREGQTLQINVLIQTGFPITGLQSPTHPLTASPYSEAKPLLVERGVVGDASALDLPYGTGVFLQQVETYPNKDFVLRFSRAQATRDLSVASYYDPAKSKGYFFCTIFPDTTLFEAKERPSMDIVLLVDISGSQSGWPIQKEKEIASLIIDRLQPNDRLTLLSFNTVVTWCFDNTQSVAATPENIEKARTFINGLEASGGTDLLSGVQSALSSESGAEPARYFVFLTDGFITNETAIFDAIRTHPSSPTIFTFGAGNNLNRYFLEESARIGNGFASEVTADESAEYFVSDAWNKMESPQLQDLSVSFSGSQPENVLMPLGNRLYRGCPVVVYGTYASGGNSAITISGLKNGETVSFTKEIPLASGPTTSSMLPQMWARQMIRKLGIEQGTATTNKSQIIELSLAYQVLCEYTAFLAYKPQAAQAEMADMSAAFSVALPGQKMAIDNDHFDKNVIGSDSKSATPTVRLNNGSLIVSCTQGDRIVEIALYDLRGRLIRRIANFTAITTRVQWDGIGTNGARLPPGRYLIRIRTTAAVTTQMVAWH